jgi:hypothetical protein
MSAFSDWNGPDNNRNVPILPILRALEEKVQAVQTQLAADELTLGGHIEGNVDFSPQSVHNANAALASLLAQITTAYKLYTDAQISTRVTNEGSPIRNLINTAQNNAEAYAKDYADERLLDAKDFANTQDDAVKQLLTVTGGQGWKSLTDLTNQVNAYIKYFDLTNNKLKIDEIGLFTAATLKIRNDVDIYGKLHCKQLRAEYNLDFVNFAFKPGLLVNADDDDPMGVLLIGELSQDWQSLMDGQQFPDASGYTRAKPARVYLKFVNTEPWEAIVDMTVSYGSSTSAPTLRGGVSALVAMDDARSKIGPHGFKGIGFGLYYSTTPTGEYHVYLGIKVHEVNDPDAVYHTNGIVAGCEYYMAGVNFIPGITTAVSSAHLIQGTAIKVTNTGEFAATNINATGNIGGGAITDGEGNVIIENPPTNETIFGSRENPKDLIFYSNGRPTVYFKEDGGDAITLHKMAFLSDIIQSIYWQRSVDVVYNTLTGLDGMKLYYSSSGTLVSPDDPDVDPDRTVAGMYTTNPYTGNPQGIVFTEGMTALIRDPVDEDDPNKYTETGIPDGVYSETFNPAGGTGTLALISGVDADQMVYGPVYGTLLKDSAGTIARCTSKIGETFTYETTPLNYFTYQLPTYATFSATGHWVALDPPIPLPKTFDGIISHVTYEWSGHVDVPVTEGTVPYFHDSYVTWIPRNENNLTLQGHGKDWDEVLIDLSGYRTYLEQDRIDKEIVMLDATQPDYEAQGQTLEVTMPGTVEKVTIPNPAFIKHKPWTGIAEIDGGSFMQPAYNAWLYEVDGGDYTDSVLGKSSIAQGPGADEHFPNAIMRLMRGTKREDMPEVGADKINSSPAYVWNNYKYSLRWIDDTKELWFNDGSVPAEDAPWRSDGGSDGLKLISSASWAFYLNVGDWPGADVPAGSWTVMGPRISLDETGGRWTNDSGSGLWYYTLDEVLSKNSLTFAGVPRYNDANTQHRYLVATVNPAGDRDFQQGSVSGDVGARLFIADDGVGTDGNEYRAYYTQGDAAGLPEPDREIAVKGWVEDTIPIYLKTVDVHANLPTDDIIPSDLCIVVDDSDYVNPDDNTDVHTGESWLYQVVTAPDDTKVWHAECRVDVLNDQLALVINDLIAEDSKYHTPETITENGDKFLPYDGTDGRYESQALFNDAVVEKVNWLITQYGDIGPELDIINGEVV